MSFVGRVEAWVELHRDQLESAGPVVIKRSPAEWDKSSIQILVQAPTEPELLVWESGEVEFGVLHADGTVTESHLDLTSPDDLDPVFLEMLSLLGLDPAR